MTLGFTSAFQVAALVAVAAFVVAYTVIRGRSRPAVSEALPEAA